MKKGIIAGLVVISVATVSLMAFGGANKCADRGFGHKPQMAKIFQQLDLSDTQKTELKNLRELQREQRKLFIAEKRANNNMSEIFNEKGFDKAKFITKATEGSQKRINSRADFMEKLYAILDENQRNELVSIMQEQSQRAKR